MTDPDPLRCPFCGERVMLEYDPALRRWFCTTCGRLFSREKDRRV